MMYARMGNFGPSSQSLRSGVCRRSILHVGKEPCLSRFSSEPISADNVGERSNRKDIRASYLTQRHPQHNDTTRYSTPFRSVI